eukprot:CAMPEP_0181481944 /NCGR_PEP_ID=MMETSP1110-20121109/44574_1 /TAXON_ID=174948 /ORGANISM="Symbiodinium sp., Strain CCMP421" /LENGTH=276 /DNA_ID=CAMNT_0023607455 /DNA_START=37 /DNA_END=867 /DNA_ORIENTATION=-
MVGGCEDQGRNSRRSSDTKVPSDLSDGSTHDDLQRQQKSEMKSLEDFAKPKRENWCDVRDDDDSDDRDLWLSASPFAKESASPAVRGVDSPREEGGKPPESPPAQLPGSVVTIRDIGLPCSSPQRSPVLPAQATAPPSWPGIMSTSPIEQRPPPVFLPSGALCPAAPCGSPMSASSVATIMPAASPTGDASTRTIFPGSPVFMQGPMTPMADQYARPAPRWPEPQYQSCWAGWAPQGGAWVPDPAAVQWQGVPAWGQGVPQSPYTEMAGYSPNMGA